MGIFKKIGGLFAGEQSSRSVPPHVTDAMLASKGIVSERRRKQDEVFKKQIKKNSDEEKARRNNLRGARSLLTNNYVGYKLGE